MTGIPHLIQFCNVHIPDKPRKPFHALDMRHNVLSLVDSVDPAKSFFSFDPTRSKPEDVLGQRPVIPRIGITGHNSRSEYHIGVQASGRAGKDLVGCKYVDIGGRDWCRLESVIGSAENDGGRGLDAIEGMQSKVVLVCNLLGKVLNAGVDV